MAGKSHHYAKSIAPYKARLRVAVSRADLQSLHHRSGARHLAYAARQLAIMAACSVTLWHATNPLVWVPVAALQGSTFFGMTVLLHEAVHNTIFARTRPGWTRLLAYLYAITSGISASQFTRWHLDHHANLGSEVDDPKRRWLSPKRNARWYKLLYCTPALIPIYFNAASRESASYPLPLRVRIKRERLAGTAVQAAVMLGLFHFGGWAWSSPAVRIQIVPYLLVFPVAFTLNRLGQHYNIDPSHPLKWTTLMGPSRFWDFIFLYSGYHLEHHYFPGVPFYNLRRLHFHLQGLYQELGLRPHTYGETVWDWFVHNKAPHTLWEASAA